MKHTKESEILQVFKETIGSGIPLFSGFSSQGANEWNIAEVMSINCTEICANYEENITCCLVHLDLAL